MRNIANEHSFLQPTVFLEPVKRYVRAIFLGSISRSRRGVMIRFYFNLLLSVVSKG
jgi:hypothetical protein